MEFERKERYERIKEALRQYTTKRLEWWDNQTPEIAERVRARIHSMMTYDDEGNLLPYDVDRVWEEAVRQEHIAGGVKKYVSYDKMQKELCVLAESFEEKPDMVVGIARGGCVPATIISHHLEVPLQILHYSTRDKMCENEGIREFFLNLSRDKYRIVLVEDIIDSGLTVKTIREACEGLNLDIEFASYYYNVNNEHHQTIKYYVEEHDPIYWISFPWEKR